jgi:hypothetical protein
MIDEHDLREMLHRRANALGTPVVDARKASRRARRRLAVNGAVAMVAVAVIALAGFAGIGELRSSWIPADESTPSASTVTSPTPSLSPQVETFGSQTYGYSVTLPKGWTAIQASARWDGKGSPGSQDVVADQFIGLTAVDAWAFAAPTTKSLGEYERATITGTLKDHGGDCPARPAAKHPIQIGGHPGMLLEWDCGFLINQAVAVHNGVGYFFGLRDPSAHAASNARDRKLFLRLLDSVQFAD